MPDKIVVSNLVEKKVNELVGFGRPNYANTTLQTGIAVFTFL